MGSSAKVCCFVGLALVALVAPSFGGSEAQAVPAMRAPAGGLDDSEGSPVLSRERGKDLGNGMRCTFGSDCRSGSCVFKVCKAKGGGKKQLTNGAACTFGSECASGSCVFKACKAKGGGGKQLGTGMKCTFASDCASKKCVFKVCKR